jgi:hypothetical protein
MMSMGVGVFARETRHDNIGAKLSHHPNDISENLIPVPNPKGLLG